MAHGTSEPDAVGANRKELATVAGAQECDPPPLGSYGGGVGIHPFKNISRNTEWLVSDFRHRVEVSVSWVSRVLLRGLISCPQSNP